MPTKSQRTLHVATSRMFGAAMVAAFAPACTLLNDLDGYSSGRARDAGFDSEASAASSTNGCVDLHVTAPTLQTAPRAGADAEWRVNGNMATVTFNRAARLTNWLVVSGTIQSPPNMAARELRLSYTRSADARAGARTDAMTPEPAAATPKVTSVPDTEVWTPASSLTALRAAPAEWGVAIAEGEQRLALALSVRSVTDAPADTFATVQAPDIVVTYCTP